jgi:histidinol-phosphatase (PHP family)
VLDYHLHLWEHSQSDVGYALDQVAAYCEQAARRGVTEVALTEHAFRFRDVLSAVGDFWSRSGHEPSAAMAAYFDFHARNDLAQYVDFAERAREEGLPVRVGLEVDLYRDRMEPLAQLLEQFPFDVLIGSVHWLDEWLFDDLDDEYQMEQWRIRDVDEVWRDYGRALEELAESRVVDVLAHPDVIKVAGFRPDNPDSLWSVITEAALTADLSVEVSSAGWFKPANEPYPAPGLLDRLVARGVRFTTASDAHRLERVGARMDDLATLLESRGVHQLASYDQRRRLDVSLRGPEDSGVSAQ